MLSFLSKIFNPHPVTRVYVGWYGDSSCGLTITFSSPYKGFPLMYSFTCKDTATMRREFKKAMEKKSLAKVTRFISANDTNETFETIQEVCHSSMRLRGFK